MAINYNIYKIKELIQNKNEGSALHGICYFF